MSNLTTIETRFLANAEIKEQLNTREIRTTQRAIANAETKVLTEHVRLGKLMIPAHETFKSEAFKTKMENDGLSWDLDQFSRAVFGKGRSQFFKYIKVAKYVLDDSTLVDTFYALVQETEANCEEGKTYKRSMDAFDYYCRNGQLQETRTTTENTDSGNTEEVESSEVESSEVESSESNCDWSLSVSGIGAVRKDNDGVLTYSGGYTKNEFLEQLERIKNDILAS
tara:strand:+ start:383 stop:1057 length:675 start_codon:yes stop_codon:yes gene_type:complete